MKSQVHSSRNAVADKDALGPAAAASDPIETERQYGARNYEPLPVVMAHGEGVWLWTSTAGATSTCSRRILR
jgi:hypothetical protein